MDQHMLPARGQTVLVRNEADVMADVLGVELGDEEVCYVMQRAAGASISSKTHQACLELT